MQILSCVSSLPPRLRFHAVRLIVDGSFRYMDDAEIQEAGTHEALLAQDGEYARIWRLQAEAFL